MGAYFNREALAGIDGAAVSHSAELVRGDFLSLA
jgi:hypothetical protein